MSKTIEIYTKETIDTDDLYRFLQSNLLEIKGEQKSETGFYFFINNQSHRGVDFYKEEYGYELRMTILSSEADYQIAEAIWEYFSLFVKDAQFLENDEKINRSSFFDFKANAFTKDADLVKILVNHHQETITFFGPKSAFYVGTNVLKRLSSETDNWSSKLKELILKVQYSLPQSESDNVLETGEETNKKVLKVVAKDVNYVLKKYDYLIFNTKHEAGEFNDMIIVTNETLNQNLPDNWNLIDEYTIVANALSDREYKLLCEKIIEFDCKDEFQKK